MALHERSAAPAERPAGPDVYDVGAADFEEKVLDASHRVPVVVDFWAPWCGPCKALGPILEKLAREYGGRFILAKINSDDHPELAQRYGVRGIPNVKAFVSGRLADEFTGALPESGVRAFLEGIVPSIAEPLRQEALAAATRGDADTARALLLRAIDRDPGLEAAHLDLAELALSRGGVDEARQIVEALAPHGKDASRIEALEARIKLAAAGEGIDAASLEKKLAANPGDMDVRLKLAHALAASRDYRGALEHLLEIVRRDRKFGDDIGRKTMLTLFTVLAEDPAQEDLVREFRTLLARTIN